MIRQLSILSGLAIIGVVIHHSVHWVLTAMFWWADRYRPVTIPDYTELGSVNYFLLRLIDQFAIIGFMAFLFVSGVFVSIMAGRSQKTVSLKALMPRIVSLIIPYLIWSSLNIAYRAFLGDSYSAQKIIYILLTGGAAIGYYFIPLLVLCYLISPILIPFGRDRWILLLTVSGVIHLIALVIANDYLMGWAVDLRLRPFISFIFNWPFLANIFWFVLGIVIGFHSTMIKQALIKVKWFLYIGAGFFFVASMIQWDYARRIIGKEWVSLQLMFCNQVFILLLLLIFIAHNHDRIPFRKQIIQIGSISFSIFLIHPLVLELTAKVIYRVLPGFLALYFPFQVLLIGMGLGIPFLIVEVANRTMFSRYLKYVLG